MRKMDLTLWALARCPFLSVDDLALLAGTGARAARAHLARLGRAGLVDRIHPPGTRLSLYYLAPAGIVAAARTAGTSPATLAARYGLGDRALQRRLPALERLVAGRRVLLALHQELAARGGRLEEWRAWPVPWPYSRGSRCRVLSLDGEGMMRLPACWGEGGAPAFRLPVGRRRRRATYGAGRAAGLPGDARRGAGLWRPAIPACAAHPAGDRERGTRAAWVPAGPAVDDLGGRHEQRGDRRSLAQQRPGR